MKHRKIEISLESLDYFEKKKIMRFIRIIDSFLILLNFNIERVFEI